MPLATASPLAAISPDSDRTADAPQQCPNIGHVT
jgi:hypothetical protein